MLPPRTQEKLQPGTKSRRYAELQSAGMLGVTPRGVEVQVHLTSGLPAFHLVGLGDTAVKESHRRVTAALKNSGFRIPDGVITVNLAPALFSKVGTGFDLAIAIAILVADGFLPAEPFNDFLFVGELGLNGAVSNVRGMVGLGLFARKTKQTLVCGDTSLFDDLLKVETLELKHLSELHDLQGLLNTKKSAKTSSLKERSAPNCGDFSEVLGQHQAVRALAIAAAGQHNLMMLGSPGTGKSMLASRLPGILPRLSAEELIETALIFSVAGESFDHRLGRRPFRSPHHSATAASIIGGGNPVKPGEVSLAHNGVLFLDEMPHFSSGTLQSLRQPIEDETVSVVRAQGSFTFPANFMLVAAANPCPCGYLGDRLKNCRCLPHQIEQYQSKLGGPLMDRFDLFVSVPRPNPDLFFSNSHNVSRSESSAEIFQRVMDARNFTTEQGRASVHHLQRKELCSPELAEEKALQLLRRAAHNLKLSGRSVMRTLRLARTIADLDLSPQVTSAHMGEALSYRRTWGSYE